MTEAEPHATTIELKEPPPLEVPVGATFVVKVAVTCVNGCDLHEQRLAIAAPAGAGEARQSASEDPEIGEFHEIAMRAPPRVGEHVWRIALAQASDVGHKAEPLAISVSVKPQATSLAVWDIPSPVVMGQAFAIKAGAKVGGRFQIDRPHNRSLRRDRRRARAGPPGRCALAGHQRPLLDRASPGGAGAGGGLPVVGALRRCRCRASA